jgi:PAS domain S-box-containing protein
MSTYGFEKSAPQASLHHLAAMLQAAVDAIISIDASGAIESINPATEKLFGYTAAELIGQNVRMLMPEPYQSQHDSYIRQYRQTAQRKIIGVGREVAGRRKDGTTFAMHLSVSEYEIDGKRHFAGIVHDLTAQRQAESASARQQTLFQAIVNDAPQAIFIADQSHKVFLVNPAVTRIFGYAPEELIGKDAHIIFASKGDYARMSRIRRGLDARDTLGASDPLPVNFRRKDGEAFPGEIIATIIRDPAGNVLGLMKLVRDITQQVKQAEALRQAQRMDALGQLTSGIAHDFNNLLTVIIGNHELFEGCASLDDGRKLVRRANDAAAMGARLTSRLLGFSRQRELEPKTVGLNEQVLNMMDMLRRSLGETIDMTTSLGSDLWTVRVDPSEIENAVLNLAINARDAMPHGGRLTIETRNVSIGPNDATGESGLAPGNYVCLAVSDTGSGMPPEVAARAFEPFFTTKLAGRGTGIGLASIFGFVKQSGGNVSIDSMLGRGTTVNLFLPRVAPNRVRAGADKARAASVAAGEAVLVVEDNPDLRTLSLERLRLLGYRVLEADSGHAAIAVLETGEKIDLIFSDVVMPGGVTGYELARLTKERYPEVRILLTSGYDAEPASAQDPARSELKVLRKPYKQGDLARALREVLEN